MLGKCIRSSKEIVPKPAQLCLKFFSKDELAAWCRGCQIGQARVSFQAFNQLAELVGSVVEQKTEA